MHALHCPALLAGASFVHTAGYAVSSCLTGPCMMDAVMPCVLGINAAGGRLCVLLAPTRTSSCCRHLQCSCSVCLPTCAVLLLAPCPGLLPYRAVSCCGCPHLHPVHLIRPALPCSVQVKPGCILRRSNVSVLERDQLVTGKQVDQCKKRMNTFGFVGDLAKDPEVSCVYHSEEAENQ